MALLLSFDTSTPHLAVVLSEDGAPVAMRVEDDGRPSHAEKLNVLIDAALREADRTLADVQAVGVGIGPGSYTGLRIGLSAAKGLCFAADIPLIALPTLGILAFELLQRRLADGGAPLFQHDGSERAYPMVDARRMEVWTHVYGADGARLASAVPTILDDAWASSAVAHGRPVVFGDGADKAAALWALHPGILHIPGIRPSAAGLAACTAAAFHAEDFTDPAAAVPHYGKEANLTRPRA
jgi:tRNA threonylcarbamoyladenosine biosynthesis protein TsaB